MQVSVFNQHQPLSFILWEIIVGPDWSPCLALLHRLQHTVVKLGGQGAFSTNLADIYTHLVFHRDSTKTLLLNISSRDDHIHTCTGLTVSAPWFCHCAVQAARDLAAGPGLGWYKGAVLDVRLQWRLKRCRHYTRHRWVLSSQSSVLSPHVLSPHINTHLLLERSSEVWLQFDWQFPL